MAIVKNVEEVIIVQRHVLSIIDEIRAEFKGLVVDTMNKMTGSVMREAIDKTVNGIW